MRRHRKPVEEVAEQPEDVGPYEGLTDEELLDAYLTNVSDDAESLPETRDEFIAALTELDAE